MKSKSRTRNRNTPRPKRALYQEVFTTNPALTGPSNGSSKRIETVENQATQQQVITQGNTSHTEIFTCQLKRCQDKNERNGLKSGTFLFAAKWRSMKIGARRVWVLDLTTLCPDCYSEQSRTLIPPGYEDEPAELAEA